MSADMSKATARAEEAADNWLFRNALDIATHKSRLAHELVRFAASEQAELLAALRGVCDAWEGKSGMGTMFEMPRAVSLARVALAKAEERR